MSKVVVRSSYTLFLRWAACLGLVSLYNNWLLTPFLNPHISIRASLISEISARTQPHHLVFQALDIAAGIATLAALPLLGHFVHRIVLPMRYLLLATIAFLGLDSIIDASLPISCAPSVDTHCSLVDAHSVITNIHMVESTVAGVIVFVAPLLWWWACRKQRAPREARLSLLFVGVQVVVGIGIAAAQAGHIEVVGSLQRLYEFSIGTWITSLMYTGMRARTSRYSLTMLWRKPAAVLRSASTSLASSEA